MSFSNNGARNKGSGIEILVVKMKFRTGISQRLEESDFTSTQERTQVDQQSQKKQTKITRRYQ